MYIWVSISSYGMGLISLESHPMWGVLTPLCIQIMYAKYNPIFNMVWLKNCKNHKLCVYNFLFEIKYICQIYFLNLQACQNIICINKIFGTHFFYLHILETIYNLQKPYLTYIKMKSN